MINLTLMRMLVAVSEEGSMGRAAEKLGLTQQAISAQLKKLEELTHRTILARTSRGVELTHDGDVLLAYARRSIDLEEDIREHFVHVRATETLRIGVVEGFTAGLTTLLRTVSSERPDLNVSVMAGRTAILEQAIERGAIDIVLGAQLVAEGRGEPVSTYNMRWIGKRDGKPGREVRLAANPGPSVTRTMMIDSLAKAGLPFTIVFESESRASLHAAVMAGIAVTALCFNPDAPSEPMPGLPDLNDIELFVRKRANSGSAADALMRVLRANAPLLTSIVPDGVDADLYR